MFRKVLLPVGIGTLVLGVWTAPAHAVVECPTGEIAETIEECPAESNTNSTDADAGIMPINLECDEATDPNCQTSSGSVAQPEKPTGTPILPDATGEEAADEEMTEEDVEENTDEEVGEPEMWPVYASLGALGATLILIIIINLTGRKSKK